MENVKRDLVALISDELNKRLDDVALAYNDALESRNSDDKSSAGDKYETGREMAQQEMNNLALRMNEIKIMISELKRLPVSKTFINVDVGSLVQTDTGLYFIGIAMGKLVYKGGIVYAISSKSPLGHFLMGKTVGDEISLNNKVQKIISIQ